MTAKASLLKVSIVTLSLVAAVATLAVALAWRGGPFLAAQQQRPRRVGEQTAPPPGGILRAGSDLNAALKRAQPGDTIVLEAGATFTGPITLPVKSGEAYITLRSSAPDSALPAAGGRVTPAYAGAMPKIISPGRGDPALKTAPGAHHFRFVGIEFKPSDSSALVYDLLQLGNGDHSQNRLDLVPHHLSFDRCYIHGDAAGTLKRGVALNSAETEIVNSYISECKIKGYDSQAIAGWNGPGPFRIENNYLEGAGENVMFGGADPSVPNLVPSDIEFRRNHVFKPTAWRGQWTVKNLFELKNAQRVRMDGNLFENNWGDAQIGFAIVFTPRNQEHTAPWSVVRDVEFTNNILRHTASAFNILGQDDNATSEPTRNIRIDNNLVYDVDGARWSGHGFGLMFSGGGGTGIQLTHNTMITTYRGLQFEVSRQKVKGLTVLNNIMHDIGGGSDVGTAALNWGAEQWEVRRNIIIGVWPNQPHPPDNLAPPPTSGFDVLGFANAASGDYRLAARSPYKKPGTDGRSIGCDLDALTGAMNAAQPAG
ncbi:MAG TPA: hypothetical protein VF538_15610 [Pyrinomonadaceae bacterium]|jgi:hypothetical protein